ALVVDNRGHRRGVLPARTVVATMRAPGSASPVASTPLVAASTPRWRVAHEPGAVRATYLSGAGGEDGMDIASVPGLITRVERIWLLQPFKKALDKRRRETVLLAQLGACVEQLFRNPRHPGLNLETLHNAGRHQILSARLTQ